MSFFHGVRASQNETSASTPRNADSGIAFVVGTAPVHTVENGKVNVPILCNSYSEAVAALGYSDDWEKYSLCEMIDSHFKLYAVKPIVVVNVLNPATHTTLVDATMYDVNDRQIKLPYEAILSSVVVQSSSAAKYEKDKDYGVFYQDNALIVEVIPGGAAEKETALEITYTKVDAAKVTKADVIGGYDVETKTYSGFELIDQVFPKFLIVPDLVLAPGWTTDSEVAAVMATKAEAINGLFGAKALIDADCETVRHYSDVPAWRTKQGITSKAQIVFWPMGKLSDKTYHLSVQAAGLMAKVDGDNGGCPCESASNKKLQIDSIVLADGTEVVMDINQANYLNSVGIVTAQNFIGGFVLWGNYTACYPTNMDVKDYFIPVSRMFNWVANSLILTYWSKTDRKMTRRLMDSIVDSVNIWLNGLVADEKLLGGRVEILDEENPTTDLMAGIIRFHLYITPPSPAQEIDFVLEYDVNYVQQALAA